MIQDDIRNLEDFKASCEGVDYVMHQTALGSVPSWIEDPIIINTYNIDGFIESQTKLATRNSRGLCRPPEDLNSAFIMIYRSW